MCSLKVSQGQIVFFKWFRLYDRFNVILSSVRLYILDFKMLRDQFIIYNHTIYTYILGIGVSFIYLGVRMKLCSFVDGTSWIVKEDFWVFYEGTNSYEFSFNVNYCVDRSDIL